MSHSHPQLQVCSCFVRPVRRPSARSVACSAGAAPSPTGSHDFALGWKAAGFTTSRHGANGRVRED